MQSLPTSSGWGTSQTGSYQNAGDVDGSIVPETAGAWPGHAINDKESCYCYITNLNLRSYEPPKGEENSTCWCDYPTLTSTGRHQLFASAVTCQHGRKQIVSVCCVFLALAVFSPFCSGSCITMVRVKLRLPAISKTEKTKFFFVTYSVHNSYGQKF